MDLNTVWFILVGVLLTGYAVLDGFDLGTGPLLLCVKNDDERRVFLNAIGPVWNGNEVWLVTGGGALFAAFPDVYATVFSGFYDVFMLLLAALIFRAVAIEVRGQHPAARWRETWDIAFAVSSVVSAMLLGVTCRKHRLGHPARRGPRVSGRPVHPSSPLRSSDRTHGSCVVRHARQCLPGSENRRSAARKGHGLDEDHGARLPRVLCGDKRRHAGRMPTHPVGASRAAASPDRDLPPCVAGHAQHPARGPEGTTRAVRSCVRASRWCCTRRCSARPSIPSWSSRRRTTPTT